jgi:hypothetical protein
MYAIYGNIYHQYTAPNVSIYTIHGSYGLGYTLTTYINPGSTKPCAHGLFNLGGANVLADSHFFGGNPLAKLTLPNKQLQRLKVFKMY